jgi:hypothetical protein
VVTAVSRQLSPWLLSTLGTVAAMDEKSAINKAAELFDITFANRNKLVVTQIEIPEKA